MKYGKDEVLGNLDKGLGERLCGVCVPYYRSLYDFLEVNSGEQNSYISNLM